MTRAAEVEIALEAVEPVLAALVLDLLVALGVLASVLAVTVEVQNGSGRN